MADVDTVGRINIFPTYIADGEALYEWNLKHRCDCIKYWSRSQTITAVPGNRPVALDPVFRSGTLSRGTPGDLIRWLEITHLLYRPSEDPVRAK